MWDEAEIRRIVDSAQWFLDRLTLVEGTQSQRSLVICFKGLSDALLHLLTLVNKRLKVSESGCCFMALNSERVIEAGHRK